LRVKCEKCHKENKLSLRDLVKKKAEKQCENCGGYFGSDKKVDLRDSSLFFGFIVFVTISFIIMTLLQEKSIIHDRITFHIYLMANSVPSYVFSRFFSWRVYNFYVEKMSDKKIQIT